MSNKLGWHYFKSESLCRRSSVLLTCKRCDSLIDDDMCNATEVRPDRDGVLEAAVIDDTTSKYYVVDHTSKPWLPKLNIGDMPQR